MRFFILFTGLIAVSFASILIKMCDAPSMVIAAYRLSIASLFFWGGCLLKNKFPVRQFSKSELLTAFGSGAFLTIHFATWIASLKYTTVTNSVLLVSTSPVFVTLGSAMFYRERPAPVLIAGVIVATLGAVVTGTQTQDAGDASMFGNFLALCGAVSVAGYLLLGRQLRSRVDTLSYVTTVYSTAAVLLLILTLLTGDPFTGYSNQTYLLLFLIALVPQVIGHTSFNWSLKHFSAATIAVITLGEPVGASILAYLLLDEYITMVQVFGGLLILAGVGVTLLGETRTANS